MLICLKLYSVRKLKNQVGNEWWTDESIDLVISPYYFSIQVYFKHFIYNCNQNQFAQGNPPFRYILKINEIAKWRLEQSVWIEIKLLLRYKLVHLLNLYQLASPSFSQSNLDYAELCWCWCEIKNESCLKECVIPQLIPNPYHIPLL